MLWAFMTSAMHIVAERDTPTRQCTSVALPSSFPRSVLYGEYKIELGESTKHTNEVQTPFNFGAQLVDPVVLHSINE